MSENKLLRRIVKTLVLLAAVGALIYGILLAIVLGGSRDQVTGQSETMIVLGCQVHPWGPSVLLQDRLDTALDYLEDHPETTVILSGGQGPDEHASEARVMADYMVEKGIDPERIILEDKSHNTWQNLSNTARLMEENDLSTRDVLLVSSGFHLTRARMLWDRITGQGEYLNTLAAPSSHAPSRLWMHVREPLALVKSFLLDR